MRNLNLVKRIGRGAERNFFRVVFFACFCAVFFAASSFAQTKKPATKTPAQTKTPAAALPKVTQIDDAKIKQLLKPSGKPLLVNFWATWCVPCREEFPDLVKIDAEYRGKIDFFTVSLDFIEEIERDVPKFLSEMKAEMPAYLLISTDESALISAIAKDWSGGLPFTILYNEKGEMVYFRQGKVNPEVLRAEIAKSFVNQKQISQLPLNLSNPEHSYEKGIAEAQKDIASGKFIVRRYGFGPGISLESRTGLKAKYNVEIIDHGCLVSSQFVEYITGYNKISTAEIKRKFGLSF